MSVKNQAKSAIAAVGKPAGCLIQALIETEAAAPVSQSKNPHGAVAVDVQAARVVSEFVANCIAAAAIDEQIRIYSALALVLPGKSDRERAARIARDLSRAAAGQLNFNPKFFGGKEVV